MAKRKRSTFTPAFKAEVVLEALRGESSQAELCRRHNLSEQQLLKWKQQVIENVADLFAAPDPQSSEAAARIAHLEPLVGRLSVALDIQKKSIDCLELTSSQACEIAEALGSHDSVRQICEVLGFTRSTFYYQPKKDPSEAVLHAEIEKFAAAYPTDGYRRITHLLVKAGYPVGYRRGVARLMKAENLSVAVKRVPQTTHSTDGLRPWVNHLKTLEVSRCDQVWVGDMTDVRLKGRFIYVCLLMDVFTRMIKAWRTSESALEPISDAQTDPRGILPKRPRNPPSRSRRAVPFKSLYRNTPSTRC